MVYSTAVVGCGLMGSRHARLLQETAGYELAAVCDSDSNLASALSTKHNVPARSFDDLLGDPQVPVLVLTLPSHLHAEYGLRAIEAGKHLIIEKPLATRPDDARRLLAAARHANRLLAVIAQNRFSDGARSLRKALQAGMLGKIVMVRASVRWFRHDEYYQGSEWRGRMETEGGGVLINQAIHSTDMLLHLLGRPQAVVAMCAKNRKVMEAEDSAVVLFQFPRHVLATLEASTSTWPGFDEIYEFQGDAGHALLKKGVLVEFTTKSGASAPDPGDPTPTTIDDPKLELFQRQYRNIHSALENGLNQLFVTPEESLLVVETTRLMYESASQLSNETVSF